MTRLSLLPAIVPQNRATTPLELKIFTTANVAGRRARPKSLHSCFCRRMRNTKRATKMIIFTRALGGCSLVAAYRQPLLRRPAGRHRPLWPKVRVVPRSQLMKVRGDCVNLALGGHSWWNNIGLEQKIPTPPPYRILRRQKNIAIIFSLPYLQVKLVSTGDLLPSPLEIRLYFGVGVVDTRLLGL